MYPILIFAVITIIVIFIIANITGKKRMSISERKRLILKLVKRRRAKFGEMDPQLGLRKYDSSDLDSLSIVHIFGFPEGTIVTILESFWYLRLKEKLSPSAAYKKIEGERINAGFPAGRPKGRVKLQDFIIYRIRLEEPFLWSNENISDKELNYSIDNALKYCKDYWKNKI